MPWYPTPPATCILSPNFETVADTKLDIARSSRAAKLLHTLLHHVASTTLLVRYVFRKAPSFKPSALSKLLSLFSRGWLARFLGDWRFSIWTFAAVCCSTAAAASLAPRDDAFLDDMQKHAMLFFAEHSDPVTGLTRDRAPNDEREATAPASISATGFALTAWCIADSRGWLPPGYAAARVRVTLRFVANHVEHQEI